MMRGQQAAEEELCRGNKGAKELKVLSAMSAGAFAEKLVLHIKQ